MLFPKKESGSSFPKSLSDFQKGPCRVAAQQNALWKRHALGNRGVRALEGSCLGKMLLTVCTYIAWDEQSRTTRSAVQLSFLSVSCCTGGDGVFVTKWRRPKNKEGGELSAINVFKELPFFAGITWAFCIPKRSLVMATYLVELASIADTKFNHVQFMSRQCIHSLELTWKWRMAPWKTIFHHKQRVFQFHVSSRESNPLLSSPPASYHRKVKFFSGILARSEHQRRTKRSWDSENGSTRVQGDVFGDRFATLDIRQDGLKSLRTGSILQETNTVH